MYVYMSGCIYVGFYMYICLFMSGFPSGLRRPFPSVFSVSIRFHPFPSVSCFRRFVSFRFQSVGIQRFISSPFRFESVSFRYVSTYLRLVVSFPAFQRFLSIRFLEILKPARFLSIPLWYVSSRVVFALTRYVALPDCVFVSF